MRKQIAVFALASALAGCVSAGTQVTEQQAQQFKKGITTESQVIAKLGSPTTTTIKDDGTRVDTYVFTHATPNAVDFVPVVGLLAGGAHGKSTQVAFTFNKSGVLQSYASTTSNVDMHTGVFN
ncbi:MAG: outer membrane protein assembly factor BamE [Alphaproteobacteria bacterium]|nr:outer membrane protein assembly factor BamE [Alphaproteobacteria bacterium]